MNIGIVTTWFERGAAYVSREYLKTLSNSNNVFIYARGGEKYAENDDNWDFSYVKWGKRCPNKMSTYIDYYDILTWIEENKIDVLIFNEQKDWNIILKLKKKNILIGTYVDYYTPKTVPFFWIFDFLLCNTLRHHGVFKDHPNAFYIPWGTDIKMYKPRIKSNNIDERNIVFFHSCGMNPNRKGTNMLVKCFDELEDGSANLIIHSQKEIDRNSDTFKIISNNKYINLIEKEIAAPGLYYLGDIYVYPTILEGIGLTIAEALSSGLPVITSDCAPMNEFVIDNYNGSLVKIKEYKKRSDDYYWPMCFCDEKDLKEKLVYFISNKKEIDKYAFNARHFAEDNLDWEKNSKQLSDDIQNITLKAKMGIRLKYNIICYDYKQQLKHLIIYVISTTYKAIKFNHT